MKPDYRQRREAGALLHIDSYSDRILLFEDGCEADPSTAEEGDDGVIAVYSIDIAAMLLDILDTLADAGIDIDELLSRAQDDAIPLLPRLQIADGEE